MLGSAAIHSGHVYERDMFPSCQGTVLWLTYNLYMHRPTKERVTAYNGKLVKVQEQIGDTSNGTGFNITIQPAPELDDTSLAIGEVVDGLDLVQDLAKLPAVRDQSKSAFFK